MEIFGIPRPATRGQASLPSSDTREVIDQKRRQLLKTFSHKMKLLLTESDQDYLLAALKEYQMYSQIEKLVHCLCAVLDTPAKLDLLRDVRHFISPAQLARYDMLVPYHRMAHPWRLSGVATMPRSRRHRVHVIATPQRTPKLKAKITNGSTEMLASEPAPLKVITLIKDDSDLLGFSIRGGSEHGLGIFVSEVEPGTPAEISGLVAGDNIIEANNISFDNIASSSAVKVLTGSRKLKMIVRRINKIPDFRSAKEKVSWYNVQQSRVVEGGFEEHGAFHHPPGTNYTDVPERRVNLTSHQMGHRFLGFNIRGGSEYGLGIYVSKVDPGSLAEECGLRVGDLIVEVNNHSFLRVTHTRAVDAVRTQKQLMLAVRDVGQYPAFKEIFAEYQWLDTLAGTITKTRSSGHINSIPVRTVLQDHVTHRVAEFPRESHVQSYTQSDDDESNDETEVPLFHSADLQTDMPTNLLPQNSDIELRKKPVENMTNSPRKNSPGRHKDKAAGRPTLAVRAMELETRAKYPELAEQLDQLSPEERAALNDINCGDLEGDEERSWSFKDVIFGSKSGATSTKHSSQGTRPSKNRSHKPLTSLNFMKKSTSDEASCFEKSLASPLINLRQKSSDVLVEELTRERLTNKDEVNAVLRHVKVYQKEKNLNQLLSPLLAILDTHEKLQLLRDIRGVILPVDLADYDRTVVNQEQLRLRQEAMRQSPKQQISTTDRQTDNRENLKSPGRRPIYKSTRQEDYRKDIEAQQHHMKEKEKRKFEQIRPPHCGVEKQKREYSGEDLEQSEVNTNGDKADLTDRNIDLDQYPKNPDVRPQSFSGPFLEDIDSQLYCTIGDVNKARLLNESIPGTQSHAGGPARNSRPLPVSESQAGGATQDLSSECKQAACITSGSPVYAQVKKPDRKSAHDPLHDMSYIESNNLYGGLEDVDLPEADAQLLHQGAAPMSSSSRNEDFWDSQSETYQEAKKALNFIDNLETEEDDDKGSGDLSSPRPQSSLWSSLPDTPRSDASSLAESRCGSYDVNPVSESPKVKMKTGSGRSPPRFIPPPPPSESPPLDDPDDRISERDPSVSGISYTKRQHSYDKERFLQRLSGNRDNSECSPPPVPRKENLDTFRIESHLTDFDKLSEVVLRKSHASLGFSISGGTDSKTQPDIRVDQVFPGGAAAVEGTLQAGMLILSVDDHSLSGATHKQAVDLIRKTFSNKLWPTMTLTVRRPLQA